jgi:hypothetical protein
MKTLILMATALLGALTALPVAAQQQATTLTKTTWEGRTAYRLSDGKTEAVIVPELSSRVIAFGFVGGPNVLWNAAKGREWKPGEWKNWGGEKVWPSPQSAWPVYFAPPWPPHTTYDGDGHKAEVVSGNRLRTTGPVMQGWGVRAVREFGFDPATGDFVITTTFRKESGEPRQIAVWNVTQVPQPDAVFLQVNPDSTYKTGYHWFGGTTPKEAQTTAPAPGEPLLYRPTPTGGYKLGLDAPVITAVAVKGDLAFVLHADKKKDEAYPEGADGSGFPVTVWNNGSDVPDERYNEIEIQSPLTIMKKGDTLMNVVHWSLHRLPGSDVNAPDVKSAVADLLKGAR